VAAATAAAGVSGPSTLQEADCLSRSASISGTLLALGSQKSYSSGPIVLLRLTASTKEWQQRQCGGRMRTVHKAECRAAGGCEWPRRSLSLEPAVFSRLTVGERELQQCGVQTCFQQWRRFCKIRLQQATEHISTRCASCALLTARSLCGRLTRPPDHSASPRNSSWSACAGTATKLQNLESTKTHPRPTARQQSKLMLGCFNCLLDGPGTQPHVKAGVEQSTPDTRLGARAIRRQPKQPNISFCMPPWISSLALLVSATFWHVPHPTHS
jgi:hypothetical protein